MMLGLWFPVLPWLIVRVGVSGAGGGVLTATLAAPPLP